MHAPSAQTVGRIYEAALGTAGWPSLVAEICAEVGAVAGVYAGLDRRRGCGAFWHAHNHPPEVQRAYNERWVLRDPTLAHVLRLPGQTHTCADYISESTVARHPFYQEFMTPVGIRYVLSGVVEAQGSTVSFFGFQRPAGAGPFGAAEVAYMDQLIPHFRQAAELAARVSQQSQAHRSVLALIDRWSHAVVFVDRDGRIQLTNQAGEALLQAAGPVRSRLGHLEFEHPEDQQSVLECVRRSSNDSDALCGVVSLSRGSSGVMLRAVVLPLSDQESQQFEGVKAAIVFAPVEQPPSLTSGWLQQEKNLSAAELRVVLGLVEGASHEDLGARLHLSIATIKTHVRNAFRKLGIHRQADLVRLVYSLPALI